MLTCVQLVVFSVEGGTHVRPSKTGELTSTGCLALNIVSPEVLWASFVRWMEARDVSPGQRRPGRRGGGARRIVVVAIDRVSVAYGREWGGLEERTVHGVVQCRPCVGAGPVCIAGEGLARRSSCLRNGDIAILVRSAELYLFKVKELD